MNNINLKSYELEFEADPLFHKMSQSFDEGGAKGMLLANLGVYDGCKILLNSSDVGVSTRKPLAQVAASDAKVVKDEPDATRDVAVKKEVSDPNKRISLASFGSLACFTEDVLVRHASVCRSCLLGGIPWSLSLVLTDVLLLMDVLGVRGVSATQSAVRAAGRVLW